MVIDGNDMREVVNALYTAKRAGGKPTMIIALNTPGKGVSFAEGKHEWHGKAPKEDEAEQALEELEDERRKIEGRLL